jgi:hypothetical protein
MRFWKNEDFCWMVLRVSKVWIPKSSGVRGVYMQEVLEAPHRMCGYDIGFP